MTMVQKERRHFSRYYAPESFVATGVFPPKREYSLKVNNIGIDSIGFDTELDLSREAIFSLAFEIENKEGETVRIHTLASILWFVSEKEPAIYTAGAQFLGLTKIDRENLQEFLDTLETGDDV
jgi:hypothetical protein